MKKKTQRTGENKKRKLTVQSRYFYRKQWPASVFPEIRLCGKWLEDAGFEGGHKVAVFCMSGKLLIIHTGEGRAKRPLLH